MNSNFVLAGAMCLILAGMAGGDYVVTSIITDGSAMLSSVGSDENDSHASRIMTVDNSVIVGSLSGRESIESDVSVRGSGPILISDYTSSLQSLRGTPIACSFIEQNKVRLLGRSDMFTSGILSRGSYQASRSAGSDLLGSTEMNGTGMVVLGSQSQGNRTWNTRSFVFGNMSARDFVQYGEKE
ncbi:MAG TPA: hypothetical protein VN372_03400 [Methanospirillum sp.]|nr:hypothetical protein [Methanospirillum sp.]